MSLCNRIARLGLSPRVRGNRRQCKGAESRPRSIPACAGEPDYKAHTSSLSEVYPRVCGGTQGGHPGTESRRGLSPRVRGNHNPVVARMID